MISDSDWDVLCALLHEGWPGDFDDETATVWRMMLADFDADQVGRGVTAHMARGGSFRPSVSELVGEIRRDPGKPTFAQVVEAIFGPDGVLSPMTSRARVRRARIAACQLGCDDGWSVDEATNTATPCECRGVSEPVTDEIRLVRADERHRLIGGFVRDQGLARLRRLDLEHPKHGEARRKLLGDAWEEFLDREETREVHQLAGGRRRGELVRFDPAALIERRSAS